MATTTSDAAGPAERASRLTRPQLYAGTFAVLIANAVAAKVIQAFAETDAGVALVGGGGLSWATWLGVAACLRLALTAPPQAVRRGDLWLAGAALAVAMIPVSQLSGLACTGVGLWVLFDRSQGERMKAAAMVLVALSIQLLWSRILMLAFVTPIASFDAHLVSLITHQPVYGQEVQFADGDKRLAILAGCTSVQNASTALVLYVAIVRSFRPIPQVSELAALAGVFVSVMAVNTARLALMAQSVEMYHRVHGDLGAAAINVAVTLIGLAWAAASVRREILA